MIPGDPLAQEQAIPEEIMESLRTHYGLNKPLLTQYALYLKNVLFFDLGPSFTYEGRLVTDIIKEGFPISFFLGAQALVVSVVMGVGLGSISALSRGKTIDTLAMTLAVLGISVPSFLLASMLQYVLAMKLNLFPIARCTSHLHTILPTLAISAGPTAFIARLTRANMIETLSCDYILAAKAKGLSPWKIFRSHVLKNSMLPILTYMGPLSASILTGSFIVERIFGIPGLGSWFVSSITNRDYCVVMGMTIFFSAFLLIALFVVELITPLLDPRIKTWRRG